MKLIEQDTAEYDLWVTRALREKVQATQARLVVGGLYSVEQWVEDGYHREATPGSVEGIVRSSSIRIDFASSNQFWNLVHSPGYISDSDLVVVLRKKLVVVSGTGFCAFVHVLHPAHGPCWLPMFLSCENENETTVIVQLQKVSGPGGS